LRKKSERKAKKSKGKAWIIFGLLTGLIFGVGNFFMANIAEAGILATSFLGLGGLLSILTERTLFFFLNRSKRREKQKSRFFEEETGKLKYKNILLLLSNIVLQFASNVLVAYSMYFGGLAGINQGIIPTLFGLSSFFSAVIFYVCFREKISIVMLFGMILLLGCVALISIGAGSSAGEEEAPKGEENS